MITPRSVGLSMGSASEQRDKEKRNTNKRCVPTYKRTHKTQARCGRDQICYASPEIKMHAPNGKCAVMVNDLRNKHQRGEERKCLKEICRRLVDAVCHVVKWRNLLFAAASSPTI